MADYYSMHTKLQLELVDKCLDTALSSVQGQGSIAARDTRQDRDSNPQNRNKAKTMTPETKTKAKAPKNCLETVSRQDTALRLKIKGNIAERLRGKILVSKTIFVHISRLGMFTLNTST